VSSASGVLEGADVQRRSRSEAVLSAASNPFPMRFPTDGTFLLVARFESIRSDFLIIGKLV
jgi:hypothetical protein